MTRRDSSASRHRNFMIAGEERIPKLGVRDRVQAVVAADESGLVRPGGPHSLLADGVPLEDSRAGPVLDLS